MSIGRMVLVSIAAVLLGIISGIITRNIFVAIFFPVLLIGFLLMWQSLQKIRSSEEKEKNLPKEDYSTEKEKPPVSTYFPPKI